MKIGIVGKPNSGKSTFFRAATLINAKIGNFPFTTINPNIGFGFVRIECPEKFFKVKCNPRVGFCIEGNRFVPVELIDVAGLVPGAHKGRGMGNKFLDDLRQADCLIHVVDASGTTDSNGRECLDHNPLEDVKFLEDEINYWFLSILERNWKKINDVKDIAKQLSGLKVSTSLVSETIKKLNFTERVKTWSYENKFDFVKKLREKINPIIIAANKVDKVESEKWIKDLIKIGAIPCSAEAELALKEAEKNKLIKYIPGDNDFKIIGKVTDKQREALEKIKKILKKFGSTGVQEVINKAVFDLLKYIVVFPGGVKKLA
ncbi:MAG: redox-regulated ATPase YchF, partial [Candidatus Aenigmatarchaeota archaeon]